METWRVVVLIGVAGASVASSLVLWTWLTRRVVAAAGGSRPRAAGIVTGYAAAALMLPVLLLWLRRAAGTGLASHVVDAVALAAMAAVLISALPFAPNRFGFRAVPARELRALGADRRVAGILGRGGALAAILGVVSAACCAAVFLFAGG